jgi:hypothetical protein
MTIRTKTAKPGNTYGGTWKPVPERPGTSIESSLEPGVDVGVWVSGMAVLVGARVGVNTLVGVGVSEGAGVGVGVRVDVGVGVGVPVGVAVLVGVEVRVGRGLGVLVGEGGTGVDVGSGCGCDDEDSVGGGSVGGGCVGGGSVGAGGFSVGGSSVGGGGLVDSWARVGTVAERVVTQSSMTKTTKIVTGRTKRVWRRRNERLIEPPGW